METMGKLISTKRQNMLPLLRYQKMKVITLVIIFIALVSCEKKDEWYRRYQYAYIYDQITYTPLEGITMALVKPIQRDTIFNGKQIKYSTKQAIATCQTNPKGQYNFPDEAFKQSTTLAFLKTVPFDSTLTQWKYTDRTYLDSDRNAQALPSSGWIFFKIANLNNRKIIIKPEVYPPYWAGLSFPVTTPIFGCHFKLEPSRFHNFNIYLISEDKKELLETQTFYVKNAYKPGSMPGGIYKEIFKPDTITVYLNR